MTFGMIGSGSWATALAKMLTDKKHTINWWVRKDETIRYINEYGTNPHYLTAAKFESSLLVMSSDIKEVIKKSDVLVVAIPSAYVESVFENLNAEDWKDKKVISAIKGLLPGKDILLNYYLQQQFELPLDNYFAVLGPCHAEEVAQEKLSYLTFSGK